MALFSPNKKFVLHDAYKAYALRPDCCVCFSENRCCCLMVCYKNHINFHCYFVLFSAYCICITKYFVVIAFVLYVHTNSYIQQCVFRINILPKAIIFQSVGLLKLKHIFGRFSMLIVLRYTSILGESY